MDLELKHLGQTLAIGGFAIYAVLYLLRICRESWVPSFFCIADDKDSSSRRKSATPKLETTAISLSLVLAAGIIVEDLSKSIVSGRDDPLPPNPGILEQIGKSFKEMLNNSVLDKDSELRLRSLFSVRTTANESSCGKNLNDEKQTLQLRPRGIFWEMTELIARSEGSVAAQRAEAVLRLMKANNDAEVLVPGVVGYVHKSNDPAKQADEETEREHQDYYVKDKFTAKEIQNSGKISEIQKFRSAVNELYYNAKNNVYTEDNYYNELSEIQQRIDFSRSLTLLCLVFLIPYGLFAVMSFFEKSRNIFGIDPKEQKSLVALAVIYLLGMWLSGIAYTNEASHHDRRVFGYYIAMVLDKEKPASAQKKTPAD